MTDSVVSFVEEPAGESGYPFATQSANLRNGARITRLDAAGRVAIFNFLYQDKQFRIRFFASRWGEDVRPLDTWTVNFGRDLTDPSDRLKSELSDVALTEIARNIRCALLAWPPMKAETSVKVVNVVFGLTGWLASHSRPFRLAGQG